MAGSSGALCGGEGWPDRRIGQIASRQRVADHARAVVGAGGGAGRDRPGVGARSFAQPPPSVYSLVPFPALPPLAVELAAVLACGDSALLSHHSAAATWGFRPSFNGDVHVTVDRQRRRPRTRHGIRVHRVSELDPRDVRRFQGIPITSPARALLEIAPDLSDRQLERGARRGADQAPDHPRRDRRGGQRVPEPPRRRPPQSRSRPRPPHHRNALRRRGSTARADPQSKPPGPGSERQSRQLHRRLSLARTEGDRRTRRL